LSAEATTAATIAVAPTRRREWLARGAFEAVLILFGLLGAFALNEWQDASRVDALLGAVRAEPAMNLRRRDQEHASRGERLVAAAR
jgi:hypothetical protein